MVVITTKAVLGFCLIFALLKRGNPLWCTYCSREGTRCNGYKIVCEPSEKSCFVSAIESTIDRQRKRMRVQGCASPSLCSNPLQYLNIGQGLYERTSIICCLGDACKRAAPRLPLGFVKPNGKECPACFVRRPDRCSQRMVDCSGEETKCLDVEYSKREGFRYSYFHKKGCATELVCAKKIGTYYEYSGISIRTQKCTPASPIT